MFLKYKILAIFVFLVMFVPAVALADGPKVESFQLHGQTGSITFNPLTGDDSALNFVITADVEVKFTTIAICKEDDDICNRTSSFKYFSTTVLATSVTKTWDGKNSKGAYPENGNYKIKVTMKDSNDITAEEFLSALIIIDSNASVLPGSGDDDDDENNNGSNSGTNDSNLSAHSGQVEVSDYDPGDIEVSAGRARLTNVKTPIEFRAESKYSLSGTFEWSFGDGTSEQGAKVRHQYNFPGQYNVVLNYSSGSEEAVSRTAVTVTEPNFELAIFEDESYLSVKNLGEWEENINDWSLKNGSSTVITFAKDTIISAGDELKIPLPKQINSELWSLNCSDGLVVTEIGIKIANQASSILSASTTAKVAELRQKLVEAQNMLAQIQKQQMVGAAALAAVGSVKFTRGTSTDEENLEFSESAETSSNSATSDIIVIGKKEGMVTKILKAVKKIF